MIGIWSAKEACRKFWRETCVKEAVEYGEGSCLKVVLLPVLMFSLQLGVGGAAMATVVSQ